MFCLVSVPLEKYYLSFAANKRCEKLLLGFKDVLYSVSGAIAAGRQMPSALELACISVKDMGGGDSDIYRELDHICRSYRQTHSDIGAMLEDFGDRSGIPEIKQFASAYRTCQKCGGDLEDVCRKNAELLLIRIDFIEDSKALISQKKLDIILLAGMPVAVLLLLNCISYSYVSVLYETVSGRVVMSLCLLLIVSALLWGIKITKLDI